MALCWRMPHWTQRRRLSSATEEAARLSSCHCHRTLNGRAACCLAAFAASALARCRAASISASVTLVTAAVAALRASSSLERLLGTCALKPMDRLLSSLYALEPLSLRRVFCLYFPLSRFLKHETVNIALSSSFLALL